MAEFKAGTREQVKNGQAQYVAGDIVAKDAINSAVSYTHLTLPTILLV